VSYNVPEHHPLFGKAVDCVCREAEVEEHRQAYLRRLGGLDALDDKTFENFNPRGFTVTDQQQASLQMAYDYSKAFAENPDGWLFLSGTYGSGKTHLAAAIANYQLEQGGRVIFVTVPDLLDHLRSGFRTGDDGEDDLDFDEVRSIPLLILDDLGTESPTPWALEKLFQLLNFRYQRRLPTVITSNHEITELEPRLRSRLADVESTSFIRITARDYRMGGLGRMENTNRLNALALVDDLRFSSWDARADLNATQRANLEKGFRAARAFADDPAGWLVLHGQSGVGKTHLAAAIANQCDANGLDVLFVTVPDLLDHLRATFEASNRLSYEKEFSEVKTAGVLVLDDLGTEFSTSWVREKLWQLFNHRYMARLPTVVTTIYNLSVLDQRLATRMADSRIATRYILDVPPYVGKREPTR
jgi:DNA replication protein DnaC